MLSQPPFTFSSVYYLSVLLHSGCYNKIPETGWLTHNQHLFFTNLESGSQRSSEAPLPSWLSFHWTLILQEEAEEGALWGLFCKGVNLILLVCHCPPYLITSQRPCLLIPSPLDLGFQHRNLRGDTNIQTIALSIHPLCTQCLSVSLPPFHWSDRHGPYPCGISSLLD